MIALCREHHDEADQGHYSKEELRRLKQSRKSSADVVGAFPSWQKEVLLIRIAGLYAAASQIAMSVGGEQFLQVSKNEVDMLSLSFIIRSQDGETIAKMLENDLEVYPDNIHDLECTAKKSGVKMWLKHRDLGLELSYKRIDCEELNDHITTDSKRSRDEMIAALKKEGERLPKAEQERLIAAWTKEDPTGDNIRTWALEEGRDDDGLIPFIDVKRIATFYHGIRFEGKHGIGGCLSYGSILGGGAPTFDFECPCLNCALYGEREVRANFSPEDGHQVNTHDQVPRSVDGRVLQ